VTIVARFRFAWLFLVPIGGCTYFTDVSRYDVCERCEAEGEDRDGTDGGIAEDARADSAAEDTRCANGRDC